ncbi:MAG: V-type ATP synthase subunit F [Candidatus Thermoplasmatota archaeon]|nr:V-type ATP synthase subunit F [Candidatus Thermoplasmatota archaeon]
MMNKERDEGRIAVIGERSISMGFRLIGIEDTFEAEGKEAIEKLQLIEKSEKYSVIFVSESLKSEMDTRMLNYYESTIKPLVMFIPLPGVESEESLEAMAKRILGIDIGR